MNYACDPKDWEDRDEPAVEDEENPEYFVEFWWQWEEYD